MDMADLDAFDHTLFNFIQFQRSLFKLSEETTNRMNRLSQAESENEVR